MYKTNLQKFLDGCCCCSVTELCPTLCDPMDCSSPGFSVHGISQARILEWAPGDLPDPGIKPVSQALAGGFFTTETPGKPLLIRGLLSLKMFSDSLYSVLDATSRGHSGVFANVKCFGSFIRICRVPS